VLVKIWISKNSEIPVRDQLIAQITIAITAGDFATGEKLPSTREVARRCDLHPNTVSAVYQRLVDQQLLEFRTGSGFYVAEFANERIEGTRKLETLIRELLVTAKELGFDEADIVRRIRKRPEGRISNELVVVESDEALRAILIHELGERFPDTRGISFEAFVANGLPATAVLTAMPDEKAKIDPLLKPGQRCIYIQGRSVSASMTGQVRPAATRLSRWSRNGKIF
jgi:DNA-binding transcriptional regulator YhcF (GntR family)